MGNRAVITTEAKNIGVYLHWNGGRDSVEALLSACKTLGFRPPESDNYGWARLCELAGLFFSGGLSLGLDTLDNLDTDNGDNGTYIIKGWEIVGREHHARGEQSEYDSEKFAAQLVAAYNEAHTSFKSVMDAD